MTIQVQICKNLEGKKKSVFSSVFRWHFGGLGGIDENVQWLKNNVDILMANHHLQQQQIKEIFKLTNLTRIEASQNRKVLRQLDLNWSN